MEKVTGEKLTGHECFGNSDNVEEKILGLK